MSDNKKKVVLECALSHPKVIDLNEQYHILSQEDVGMDSGVVASKVCSECNKCE